MSNETKFTAGPWIVCHTGPHWNNPDLANIDIQKSNGENITETVYEEADARLIAAAPEMYAMLKFLADNDSINDSSIDKEVLTLLAKARGDNNEQ